MAQETGLGEVGAQHAAPVGSREPAAGNRTADRLPTPDSRLPAIAFEHVTKRFAAAARPAVDDVSLEVPYGSLVVLLGPSGCGKTTLLKMVNRLYEHDSGRILVEGQEVRSFKVTDLRRRIGYVIQSTGLFPHMTVARNIATVPELLGWDKARIEARVDELLELVGLPPAEYRSRYPAQLSGGQQQRVGLARAMAADPSIMLMDEPFAAIDNITRRRLQDELLDIQRKVRKTILFVTHDVEEAIRLADCMAVMREGKVVQYDTPLNILSKPADDFVARLVGAHDVLRRLSLLSVQSAIFPPFGRGSAFNVMIGNKPLALRDEGEDSALNEPETRNAKRGTPMNSRPVLPAGSTLREALSLLLSTGAEALSVVNAQGETVGTLDLQSIRRSVSVKDEL